MTNLLHQAFGEASKLAAIEQNTLARWMLAEISAEQKWDNLFSESEDTLTQLAQEALADHNCGKTSPLDADQL